MSNWVLDFVQAAGYPGIALLMFLETVFPPLPSEIIMPLAGYQASQQRMNFWGALAAGTSGSALGALLLYLLGRRVPVARLEQWADRHGRWLTLSRKDIEDSVKWFQKRGGWAVFLGRLVPGMRSLISIPAGLGDMPFVPFTLWTVAGSLLWNAALAGAGFWLGSAFHKVDVLLGPVSWAAFGALAAWYLARLVRHPKS